ncbi:efflux RND transporter periplasmic adaptor subunit [Trinickia caryophylli]|uniref:Membrane fusion protein, macrolide-specific efflux system n=1 Tax=Trinickia caryophylli TaxID=28094 RepID=A0A1X7H589_TRICW|nr:efflux RND transporter periplasmic adaptor subunit [Trinickia caryophylli]PMS09577.1 efflux RND transporter periplasmic adaptor subunit [Trinickia caryophylli]TRX17291.1 efflux RND transporter periplasmic adaptor subunit [Trinickia caryophylli]WQE11968.1 efflux RND transporter periplasmic adaptor subunit [Trinickia caryophylli]SMF79559.1 membrane fusion protein, macrolide-specific efflux system [Trinickia caryophylli]GLU35639.1 drug-efflux protein [Trinickia caryophylli]
MKPARRRPLVVASLAALAMCAALSAYAVRHFGGREPARYLSTAVVRADIEDAVLAAGTLHAQRGVDVGAQVSGQLQFVFVKLGQRVKRGQPLAQIDPTLAQHALREARLAQADTRAQRRAAAARLEEARRANSRAQAMASLGAASRELAERAHAALAVAEAQLASLDVLLAKSRVEVDKARAKVGYTRILAPMDGEVVAIVAQEGQTLIAEQQAPVILKLAQLDAMTVKAEISEADVVRIVPGQRAYFTILGEPERRHEGRLASVDPAPADFAETQGAHAAAATKTGKASGAAVYYHARFDVPNPDGRLRIGMTAQVVIVLGSASRALVVPVSALGEKTADGRYAVRVVDAKGHARVRPVAVGINNNVSAEIVAGLLEHERVVIGEAQPQSAGGEGA